jgi:hypothetical protein
MKSRKLFSRGQAEVVGLLVIVLLLLFIGIVFLRFYLLDSGSSLSSTRQHLDAQHLLQGITHLSYNGKPFVDAVADCHFDVALCAALMDSFADVFTAVLRPGTTYQFTILSEDETVLRMGTCERGVVSTSTVSTADTFYDLRLRLC